MGKTDITEEYSEYTAEQHDEYRKYIREMIERTEEWEEFVVGANLCGIRPLLEEGLD